jgi:hypothetical protein
LQHQYRKGYARNPTDEADDGEDGKDSKDNSGSPEAPVQVIDGCPNGKGDVQDASNLNELFSKGPRSHKVSPGED